MAVDAERASYAAPAGEVRSDAGRDPARRLWRWLATLAVLVLAAVAGKPDGTLAFVGGVGIALAGPLVALLAVFAAIDLVRASRSGSAHSDALQRRR